MLYPITAEPTANFLANKIFINTDIVQAKADDQTRTLVFPLAIIIL